MINSWVSKVIRGGGRSAFRQTNNQQITSRHSSSQNDGTAKKDWKDPALLWAAANPKIAQSCLDIPSACTDSNLDNVNVSTLRQEPSSICFSSFEEYWSWRKWNFPNMDNPHPQALASHVLSAPLTIACQLLLNSTKAKRAKNSNNIIRWVCVGARSEASLPVEYWKEIINIANVYQSTNNHDIELSFIGPELGSDKRPPIVLQLSDLNISSPKVLEMKLTIQWKFRGMFHDYYQQQLSDVSPDAYILLNPGLGHPYLQMDWKPTLDIIFERSSTTKRKLVLLTAHSKFDALRDTLYLQQHYDDVRPVYSINPFGSRIQYKDPLSPEIHFVSPNAYVALLEI
jgi:hypothetical protein